MNWELTSYMGRVPWLLLLNTTNTINVLISDISSRKIDGLKLRWFKLQIGKLDSAV